MSGWQIYCKDTDNTQFQRIRQQIPSLEKAVVLFPTGSQSQQRYTVASYLDDESTVHIPKEETSAHKGKICGSLSGKCKSQNPVVGKATYLRWSE